MIILGINAWHGDASACVLVDGQLRAAAEEERFRRIKHWAGFPSHAIEYCLQEVGASIADVGVVAVNSDSTVPRWRKLKYLLTSPRALRVAVNRLRDRADRKSIQQLLNSLGPNPFEGDVVNVEHHLAHLASAYYCSPFQDASVVSVDGFGDFASAAWGRANGTAINVDGRVSFPHSLGIFYETITHFIGFKHYGDEYKMMGLAAYGQPKYLEQMRNIVHLRNDGSFRLNLKYFSHHTGESKYTWSGGVPTADDYFNERMVDLLGPARDPKGDLQQRHMDLAASAQAMFEEALFHMLNVCHQRYQTPNLALAGGCAMNSMANGKIRLNTPFKELYIQAAAGDAGGAIGAAQVAWHQQGGQRTAPMTHGYWGPQATESDIEKLLSEHDQPLAEQGISVTKMTPGPMCEHVAARIAEGDVIGWFQGRMEWGPRALGNRSILGDPRRADMKDILNLKIKRRESFRPFAPAILREHVADWFEQDHDVPFMMQVYQIIESQRQKIPAVAHVDGSGRLQTVRREQNVLYYDLIEAFRRLTGVPIVLNTSFNENEPIVCRPDEALDCFLRTRMDVLALGPYVLERNNE
ncbi:MAG: nodulation protein [Lysobacteraceae bacterium]|nr:MAG: nodulation protein [Xanthomonadaceae bacterium]